MKISNIMGIDVSKSTLDCHLYVQRQQLDAVANSAQGFKQLGKWLKKQCKGQLEEVLVVMEHTGIYTYGLEQYLYSQGIAYVKRPALDIKRSLGMIRGKSDKADARFIRKYGWMRKEELQPMKPMSANLLELQQLMNYRDKLVGDKASYQARIKELEGQMGQQLNSKISESSTYIMQVLGQEIKQLEEAIKELLKQDPGLNKNYELATSVIGIGFATAVHFIIATENCTRFSDARKLICYCGVAPFKHESGSSIRGRTKVSHLANKKLKCLLTMAAICAVRWDQDLKRKYEQKVAEGKPKMSVINIIRAKLVERLFAVVKRQSKYEIRLAA
ncbi:IS110 family transposase [Puia sp.]|jgi:transposase|uniref:IS110 family transposase n=1 Tax=Puia sp. TaxID=2045100 RepID=UPI002F42DA6B